MRAGRLRESDSMAHGPRICECITRIYRNYSSDYGCSELILELYGPEVGQHARTTIGVATTPFGLPVIIAAEV